jgi:hypothetical protein
MHPLHYDWQFPMIQWSRRIHCTTIENFDSFSGLDASITLQLKISTYHLTKSFSSLEASITLRLTISNHSVVSTHPLHYHWKFPIIQWSRRIHYITVENFQLSSDKVIQQPRRIYYTTMDNFQWFSGVDASITLRLTICNDSVVSTHHWQFPMIQWSRRIIDNF